MSYAASRIPAWKVLSGIPSYGMNYYTGQQVHWNAFAGRIASYGAAMVQDPVISTPYAAWGAVKSNADGTAWSTTTRQPVLWFEDASSVKAKASLVGLYGLGSTSVTARNNSALTNTIAFSGAPISGIAGARVSGKTGANSWSWIVNEVRVTGYREHG